MKFVKDRAKKRNLGSKILIHVN